MKRGILLLPLFIAAVVCLVAACKGHCPFGTKQAGDTPPQGLQKWCHKPDGTAHGRYQEWWPNGNPMVEGWYRNGKRVGRWIYWHTNGRKTAEGEYREGKKNGLWITWFPEGKKMSEGVYRSGRMHGKWVSWQYGGGKRECEYTEENPRGSCREWDQNGRPFRESFYQIEWVELKPTADDPGVEEPALTRSALMVRRAVDPDTGSPLDKSKDIFGCDPSDLRRVFRLEKKEFQLGEPLLVEFRIKVDGPGWWREPFDGGYSGGDDPSFGFLMRHEDGTWVEDTRGPVVYIGRRPRHYEVGEHPESYWLSVQTWCAINRPGKYDLYCVKYGSQRKIVGGPPDPYELARRGRLDFQPVIWNVHKTDPSPLAQHIPKEVAGQERMREKYVSDFAQFRIVIREGTAEKRQQMVSKWTRFAESIQVEPLPRSRERAAIDAMWLARQNDFLPLIEKWLFDPSCPIKRNLDGLAGRSTPRVTELLLRIETPEAVEAMRYLPPERVPDVIPQLIEWLTYDDGVMRANAESRLRIWTGKAFHRHWRGWHCERPTMLEGKKMQPLWREWWQKNREAFVPKKPSPWWEED